LLVLVALVNTKTIHNEKIRRIRNKHLLNNSVKINKIKNELYRSSSTRKRLPSCKDLLEYNTYKIDHQCDVCNIYCIDDKEKIYGLSALNKCKIPLYYDVFLFEIIDEKENRMINLLDDMVNLPSNLCLYQCEDYCIETNGYVKVDTTINKILKHSNYYYINVSGSGGVNATSIESLSDCSSYIGEIVNIQEKNDEDYVEICVSDNTSIPLDLFYGEAILSGSLSSNTPFSTNGKNENDNVIVYDFNYAVNEKHFNFYNGYLIITNNNYLLCDEFGCEVNDRFLYSCNKESSIGKLAIMEESESEKIYICSHNQEEKGIEVPFPFYNKTDGIIEDKVVVYMIEKGFPGTSGESGKTFVTIWYNNIYCSIGVNLNRSKDQNGKEYITSIISVCNFNEDGTYQCEDENAVQGEYYYDGFSHRIYHADGDDRMVEEVPLEDGFYSNKKEYYFFLGSEPMIIEDSSFLGDSCDCYENSGYICFIPYPTICLSDKLKVELKEENTGDYLLKVDEMHPLNRNDDTYRILSISNNKAILNKTDEDVNYCVDSNYKLTIKDKSCNGKEVKCKNSICRESTGKNDQVELNENKNNLNFAYPLYHISYISIFLSFLLTLIFNSLY